MKKLLQRLLLFICIPLPPLLFLDHAVEKGLHRSRYAYYADWNDLFNGKINADLLVLGTSRAYLHVSPRIFDSVLQLNSYNLGMDAASIDIQFNILKLYLKHNKKPKYILQEVGYNSFVTSDSSQYYHEFLSYIHDTTVWNILKEHYKGLGVADKYFPLYKYSDRVSFIKEGLNSYMGRGSKEVKYKGYEGRDEQWDSSFYNFKKANPHGIIIHIDSNIVTLMGQYLGYCAANDIKVILFYAPVYYEGWPYILNYEQINGIVKSYANTYNLHFFNYKSDSINYNKSLFYNSQHLNKRGSEIFSLKFASDVKQILNSSTTYNTKLN